MKTEELLAALSARKVRLYLKDGQLRASAPQGALDGELRAALAARKRELVEALSERALRADATLPPRDPNSPVPLSHAQERVWLLQALDPTSTAYHLPFALELAGRLDVPALRAAFQALVARHESLRTGFVAGRVGPRQEIRAAESCELAVHEHPQALPDAELAGWLERQAAQAFELSQPPLLRVSLARRGPDKYVLCFCLHHLIFDGWSLEIFVSELRWAYAAFARGEAPRWTPLPVSYADYSAFERSQAGSRWLQAQLDHHCEQLCELPELSLPGERRLRAAQSARAVRQRGVVRAAELAAARELARRHGTSLFVVTLAACFALLRRYSDQADVCVGSPVANRGWPELEGVLGFFANTVVLRSRLAGDVSFAALLADTRACVLDAQAHQNVPFERVVQALAPARVLGRNPLFRVAFALHSARRAPALEGLRLETLPVPRQHAMFELSLLWTEAEAELELEVEYAERSFEPEIIARVGEHYLRLLAAAVSQPELRISELPMLGPAELVDGLAHAGALARWPERSQSVTERFAEQARRAPEAPALRALGQRMSYGELDARSSWLARELRARGVGPECAVAVCVPRGPAQIVALLGCAKAGGYYVPLDPEQPVARLRELFGRSRARLVLTAAEHAAIGPAGSALDVTPYAREPVPDAAAPEPCLPRHPDQLLYQLYTSGSTGEPKGVQVSDRAVLRLVSDQRYADFAASETFLALAPLAFDASTFEIWGALLSGAQLALAPPGALSLAEIGAVLRREQVSSLWLTAALFAQLVDHQLQDLAGVKQLLAGGEVLSPSHVARLQQALPDCRLVNGYGPTENTTFSACHVLDGPVRAEEPVPIGRPIRGSSAHVLDSALQPMAAGVIGALYVGGLGLARGYAEAPELTAERFVPSPFGPAGARLYRTGDLAFVGADGNLHFVGRRDGQIKLRGHRIELAELEHALQRCPGVVAAGAAVSGEGDARQLLAYVVGPADLDTLHAALAEQLPRYMLPAEIVRLDRLPLTVNGKLDRCALPAPSRAAPNAARPERPPTETERRVLTLLCAELGREDVGLDQDFFAAGGHSLLATRVVARVEALFGVQLPLRAFFERPTAAGLAGAIDQPHGAAPREPAQPLSAEPVAPLSFSQEQLWLEERLSDQPGLYNVPVALELLGPLAPQLLEAALSRLAARHGALRTGLEEQAGRPIQRVWPEVALPLERVTLAGEAELAAWLASEASRGFDLTRPPLARAQLAALPARDARARHLFLFTLHHAIADGLSVELLLRELCQVYEALALVRPASLPALPLQFSDYARSERARFERGELAAGLAHFGERLEGAPALLALPADAARPAAQSHDGASCELPLGAALSEALRALARREAVTPFMLLCAAFAALLARVTGQRDLVLGTPMANRTRPELAHVVGQFVNTIVLRCELSDDPSFRVLLARVREEVLRAQCHQDVPFDRLVSAINPVRDPAYTPLVQVLFTYLDARTFRLELPGIELRSWDAPLRGAKFDLSLDVLDQGSELVARLEHAVPLVSPETALRLAERYRALLESIVADCSVRVSELALLPEPERAQVLAAAGTPRPLPDNTNVWSVFAEAVRRDPSAPALRDGEQQLSYLQLAAASTALSAELRRAGVGPERAVALHVPRSAALIAGVLGTLHAGGYYVPIDPELPLARRLAMLRRSACRAIVVAQDAALEPELAASAQIIRVTESIWSASSAGDLTLPAASQISPLQLAYAVYTSGSTGEPKAALISHRSLLSACLAWQEAYALTPDDRHLQLAQMSFDVFTGDWVRALCSGGLLVLCPRQTLLEPEALAALVERESITFAELVPAVLRPLLELLERAGRHAAGVRVLVCGSDAWSPADYRRARAVFPRARVVNSYGLTEATIDSAWFDEQRDGPARERLPIGRPYPNTRTLVVHGSAQLAPLGVAGELCIAGPALARGYAGRPDWTAERFVPDPWGPPGSRLYRTGDLARLRGDGSFELLGRADGQIKLHGQRIELTEIERELERASGVRAAAVALRDVGAGPKLVAYVVGTADFASVRSELAERLPEYMLPRVFVSLPALPLTRHGKLDRRALPAPDAGQTDARNEVAPRNERERQLGALWCELLGVPSVSIHDSFFELGGDSITSIQLVSRAAQLGLAFSPRDVFAHKTLAALAAIATRRAVSRAAQEPCAGPLTLAPIQRWFFAQGFAPLSHWNQSVLLSVPAQLDAAALAAASGAVHAHHDALRLQFVQDAQGVAAHGSLDLHGAAFDLPRTAAGSERATSGNCPAFEQLDLSRTAVGSESVAIEGALARVQGSLDLAAGRLWRLVWLDLGARRRGRLLLVVHHLVVDAVSLRVLLEDLRMAYAQAAAGHRIALPPKTVSYFAWTEQQLVAARAVSRADHEHYAALAREPGAGFAPDWPEGSACERDLELCTVELTAHETDRLLRQAGDAYCTTPEDVLLAALASALCEQADLQQASIDLESHGRDGELDVARTVGWFTAVSPTRLEAPRGADARALIRGIKQQLRSRPRPEVYGQLRYLADPEQAQALRPQVSFNYLGRLELGLGQDDFQPSLESRGPERHPDQPLGYELDVTAHVSEGRLLLEFGYAQTRCARARVRAFAAQVLARLRALIEHACSPHSFGYTPSDFPLARLSQAELDGLLGARRDVEDVYPVTELQQGMLLHALLEPEAGVYAEQLSCVLSGPLDRTALTRAFRELVAAHPVLRSAFVWREAGEPLTIVARAPELSIEERDLSTLEPPEQAALWRAWLRADLRRGFEVQAAPLLRVYLVRVASELHRFAFSHHHALLDGWSLGLFMSELFARYAGQTPATPPPFRNYLAYRLAQDRSAARDYFARQLHGLQPVALPREQRAGSELEECARGLPVELGELARARGLTLSSALQAALGVVLGTQLGTDDVVFGVTVSGRPPQLPGAEHMLGLFIQTLPLRLRLQPQQPARDYLAQVAEHGLLLREHDQLCLRELAELAGLPRAEALFDVLFVFENYPIERGLAEQPGLAVHELRVSGRTNYALTLAVEPSGDGWLLRAAYTRDAFDTAQAEDLLRRVELCALSLLRAPEQRLGELSLSPLLAAGATLATDFAPVQARIQAQAARTPGALAVVQGRGALSYAELGARAGALAARLRAGGVTQETAVALYLPRSSDAIIAMLAVLEAGAYYVPIDGDYPRERVAAILQDAAPRLTLTLRSLASELPERADVLCMDELELAADSGMHKAPPVLGEQLAYVIYTSGSTGRPKGVAVSAANLARSLDARLALYPEPVQRFLLLSSIAFDSSVAGIYWTLCQGGELHIPEPALRADPEGLARYVHERRISHLLAVPSLYALVLEQLPAEHALVCAVVAGEACSPALPEAQRKHAPDAQLWNEYGPTEASVFCSAQRCDGWREERVPIGSAIPGTRLHVLDTWLRPAPRGVTAELYVAGGGIARGYLGTPAATAERFLPDPFGPAGARMYRTGDWVREREDGSLEFRGRRDGQVKLRGQRVELAEIEAALAACAGVVRAAAAVRGEGAAARLVGYVEGTRDFLQLRAALARTLPDVMLPQRWVAVSSWPQTPNGKLDRARLPDDVATLAALQAMEPARDALERALAAGFEAVLEITGVGRDADFFELGGHSLLAPQLAQSLKRTAGIELPLRWLFEARSVAQIAQRLQSGEPARTADARALHDAARLPERVRPSAGELERQPRDVLLTGATGFLGAHLLYELLATNAERVVHCLVRAESADAGLARLREAFARYALPTSQLTRRVRVWCGELRAEQLGLNREAHAQLAACVGAIYHNGARVDFNADYAALAAENVRGTLAVLELACASRPKALHFISTLSVWPDTAPRDGAPYPETPAGTPDQLEGGYAQSKWVAEQLVWQAGRRGLPVTIHRPSTIGPHLDTGAWNPSDYLCSVLRAAVDSKLAPEEDEALQLVPVDYVSRVVVQLAAAGAHGVFQHNFATLRSQRLWGWLREYGYPLVGVPYAHWRELMRERAERSAEHPLRAFLAQLEADGDSGATVAPARFETERTAGLLAESARNASELSREGFAHCLDFLVERGLLPRPRR